MLRTKKTKKKGFDGEFDITPMIDVVLLLLIFFMVSARMAPQNVAVLPKAKNGEMAAIHDAVVLCIKPRGIADPAAVSTFQGKPFSNDPEQQSAEIAEYISEAFQDEKKKYLLIQGEPSVRTSEIVRVQRAAASVMNPEYDIMIAVEH